MAALHQNSKVSSSASIWIQKHKSYEWRSIRKKLDNVHSKHFVGIYFVDGRFEGNEGIKILSLQFFLVVQFKPINNRRSFWKWIPCSRASIPLQLQMKSNFGMNKIWRSWVCQWFSWNIDIFFDSLLIEARQQGVFSI